MATATKTPTEKAASEFQRATKLSTILALALADLRKAERAKDCKVNMGTWRLPKDDYRSVCEVCLAGSVMRERFPTCETPGDFFDLDNPKIAWKMYALDHLRLGRVADAWESMNGNGFGENIPKKAAALDRKVKPYYRTNPSPFWTDMRKLLADLKKAGL